MWTDQICPTFWFGLINLNTINALVLIDFVEDVTGKYGEEEELVSCGICDQIDPPHEDLPLDKVEVEWVGCDCFR